MSNYQQRIDFLVEKYSTLVKHAEQLVFPKSRREMPEKAKHWGWFKKTVHKLSHPLSLSQGGLGEIAGLILLMFLSQANLGWGVMFLAPALFQIPSLFSLSVFGDIISVVLAALFAIPLILVSYYWLYIVLASRQHRPISRIFILSLVIAFILGFSQAIKSSNPSAQLIRSWTDILPFLISYTFFLIPAITYLLIIGLETVGQIVQVIVVISREMRSMHDPLPLDQVKKLSIDEIPNTEGKPVWKLNSLTLHEIQTLRKWAETNRESTDKRTLPIIIVFGFFALLLSSDTVKQSISEPLLRFWWGGITLFWIALKSHPELMFSWRYFGVSLILVFTLFLATFIMKMFSRLFRNLAVQSLVIEACILAESSHDENNTIVNYEIPKERTNGFLRFIQSVIDLIRR